MPLIDTTATVDIQLPEPGEWIRVRATLTRAEERRIQSAIVGSGIRVDADGDVRIDPTSIRWAEAMQLVEFALLELAVVAWSFDAPVTPENIRRLDSASLDYLLDELNRRYGPRQAAAGKD